jgi:hypothetical protein
MKPLLYLQLKRNGYFLLLFLIIIFGISLFYIQSKDVMPLFIYALVVSSSSFRHMSLLKIQKMRHFIHSFPISRRDIVTATYTSVLIYIFMIYVVLLPALLYAEIQRTEEEHLFIPFTGFFAVSIASAAMEIYLNFRSNDFKESMTDSLLSSFGALFFLLPPHMGLLLLWDHEPSFYLRLLVFPIISMILFYFSLKKSIRLYETKEVI